MDRNKLAVVGDADSVLVYAAAGLEVYRVHGAEEAEKTARRLKEGYAVIFVTEDLMEKSPALQNMYKDEAYPAVVPIPSASGATGYGRERIKKNIERAVGKDIIEEGKD